MDWATEDDLSNGWLLKKPMPGDTPKREALLVRAQRRITSAYREAGLTVEKAIKAGLTDMETIKAVQVDLALANLKNPYGVTQMSETTGPFGGSMTFAEGQRGGLVLTDDMIADLGIPAFPTSRETGNVRHWSREDVRRGTDSC